MLRRLLVALARPVLPLATATAAAAGQPVPLDEDGFTRHAAGQLQRTLSSGQVSLWQDEGGQRVERVRALASFGDLDALSEPVRRQAEPPTMPPPEQCVGFDDVPEAANSTPGLTTVSQPMHQIGAEAIRILMELLNGSTKEEHLRLPAGMTIRGSTAALRG